MEIAIADSGCPECDRYVRQARGAKLCHLPAWTGMVKRVFGHEGRYLVAREGGRLCGVLGCGLAADHFDYRLLKHATNLVV